MMTRKRLLLVALLLCCCLSATGCFGRERPREELVRSIPSPNGKYTMKLYRSSGGATVDWSTTVSVADSASEHERNIYYHYHEYEPASISWLDDGHVRINDITLNIHTEYYESYAR